MGVIQDLHSQQRAICSNDSSISPLSSQESYNGEGRTSADAPYRYERDPKEQPSEAVVSAVAAVSGKPAIPDSTGGETASDALPPLYQVIDPEALDAFVLRNNTDGTDCSVEFNYVGHQVAVTEHTITVSAVS